MRITTTLLSPAALRAVVQEFVTRDGTDHSYVEGRIENVMRQLDAGRVELHFDAKTETCNIVQKGERPPTDGSDGEATGPAAADGQAAGRSGRRGSAESR